MAWSEWKNAGSIVKKLTNNVAPASVDVKLFTDNWANLTTANFLFVPTYFIGRMRPGSDYTPWSTSAELKIILSYNATTGILSNTSYGSVWANNGTGMYELRGSVYLIDGTIE